MYNLYKKKNNLRCITIGQLPHPLIGSSANKKKKRDTLFFFFIFFASVFLNHAINKFIENKHFPIIYVVIFFSVKSVELFLQLVFHKCIDRINIYIYIFCYIFFLVLKAYKGQSLYYTMFPLYTYVVYI